MPHRVDEQDSTFQSFESTQPKGPGPRIPYDVVRGSPPPSDNSPVSPQSNGNDNSHGEQWTGNPTSLTIAPNANGGYPHYYPPPPPAYMYPQGHPIYHPPPYPLPLDNHHYQSTWTPQSTGPPQAQAQIGVSYAPDSGIVYTDDSATRLSERVRRKCYNCSTTEASTWRKSQLALGKVLCNKCGLYERTHQRPRPSNREMYRSTPATKDRGPLATAAISRAPGSAKSKAGEAGRPKGKANVATTEEAASLAYSDITSLPTRSSPGPYVPSPAMMMYPPPSSTPPALSQSPSSASPQLQEEVPCVDGDGSGGLEKEENPDGSAVKPKTSVRAWV